MFILFDADVAKKFRKFLDNFMATIYLFLLDHHVKYFFK